MLYPILLIYRKIVRLNHQLAGIDIEYRFAMKCFERPKTVSILNIGNANKFYSYAMVLVQLFSNIQIANQLNQLI